MTDRAPLTAAELAAIEARHAPIPHMTDGVSTPLCRCNHRWPCPTSRLVAGLRATPRRPGVGTGAVVIRRGSLLMVERGDNGTWSVPGGWVEWAEEPEDCAAREVLEETGIQVEALGTVGWTNSYDRDPDGTVTRHAITLWIRCAYVAGEPTVTEPEKCPRVEWVPFNQVTKRPLFVPMDVWWPAYAERTGRLE